ncbi:MAG: outer membrane beta-barrel protein, partial [Caulobacteraceae bacterium]
MNRSALLLCAGAAALGLAMTSQALADDQGSAPAPAAAPAAPAPTPMPYPAMTPPLAANPNPPTVDAGPIMGKITVDGVLSGMGLWQTHPQIDFFGSQTRRDEFDVTNAQIIINKSDGPVQFYIQAGAYALPALGAPYVHAAKQDDNSFGFAPQGFLKLVLSPAFSVQAGALPTLIGDEYTFT